jgi:hypothetical protein
MFWQDFLLDGHFKDSKTFSFFGFILPSEVYCKSISISECQRYRASIEAKAK